MLEVQARSAKVERILHIFCGCSSILCPEDDCKLSQNFLVLIMTKEIHELTGLQFYGTCESRTSCVPDHVNA